LARRVVGIIKNPDDDFGGSIPVTEGIIRFLAKGRKQLSEIIQFVHDNRLPSSPKYTKQGILKILWRLEYEERRISKKKRSGDSYPKYFLTQHNYQEIELQASLFAADATRKLLRNSMIAGLSGQTEEFVNIVIKDIGLYHLYAYAKSVELSFNARGKQKDENRLAWLRNAFPMTGLASFMDVRLKDLGSLRKPENKKYWKKLFDVVDLINKQYPEEIKVLNEVWNELENSAKEQKRFYKKMILENKRTKYNKRKKSNS